MCPAGAGVLNFAASPPRMCTCQLCTFHHKMTEHFLYNSFKNGFSFGVHYSEPFIQHLVHLRYFKLIHVFHLKWFFTFSLDLVLLFHYTGSGKKT